MGSELAPGARITVRDEDWVVRRVDPSDDGGSILTCDGLSELVRGTSSLFLTRQEESLALHKAEETQLFLDESPYYSNALLYLESQRLRVVPNDQQLHRGHQAVMNTAPYQLIPAQKGLSHVRTRILIADGVGLGKTLEAAILATELDIRGRGRRVLVITQKSMLTQFQKEWWSRFTIPLVRLDSEGIQRIRSRIPSGHNPFNYYDKTIISMDTLKGNSEYRNYLDRSRWDLIVIDECHNVAIRKGDNSSSQRARLAKQLATKSDTLILLSATPHDGSAKSFASLIWLLDPTVISDPEDYSREDLDRKDLFVRRFKKDIKGQAGDQFLEPVTYKHDAIACPEEERAFEALLSIRFTQGGERKAGKASELQRVGLQKAIFSSPAAAVVATQNRLRKIDRPTATEHEVEEVDDLKGFLRALDDVTPAKFSKYQLLVERLKSKEMGWSWKDPSDRLVIFSERIETLKWLEAHLTRDLGLKDDAIEILDGGLSDVEQQSLVERFGRQQEPLRVLLCSDVASEGINLHYYSHRLFHFDLPWSLMVFQQRNGRVDRFGQKQVPQIHYLLTHSEVERIKGDLRILEILQQKDEQVSKNIGDPASFLRCYSAELEVEKVVEAMVEGVSPEAFAIELDINGAKKPVIATTDDDDWMSLLFDDGAAQDHATPAPVPVEPHSLFPDWYAFAKAVLKALNGSLDCQFEDATQTVRLTPPTDLKRRLRQQLPIEVLRENAQYHLSAQAVVVEEAILRARQADKNGSAWPEIQYLWPQHPIFAWMVDRVVGTVGRQRAPLIVSHNLAPNERAYLMLGLIPNRKGQPLVTAWKAVVRKGNEDFVLEDFDTFCRRACIAQGDLPNRAAHMPLEQLQTGLGDAVATMQLFVETEMRTFSARKRQEIGIKLAQLQELQGKQELQLQLRIDGLPESMREARKAQRQRDIQLIFDEYRQWVRDTLDVEPVPYVQVLAAVTG